MMLKPLTEVEKAFARAKHAMLKREIANRECGVVYPPEFNHWLGDHPEFAPNVTHLHNWGSFRKRGKKKKVHQYRECY